MSHAHFQHSGSADDAAQARMLARIRRALGRRDDEPPSPPPPPPEVDAELVRLARGDDPAALLEVFTRAAAEVGTEVIAIRAEELAQRLTMRLHQWQASDIILPATHRWQAIAQDLGKEGFSVLDWQGGDGEAAVFNADAGLTGVTAAIAETGTLVIDSSPAQPRSLSLVPPYHLAVLNVERLIADMADLFNVSATSSAAPAALPSERVLITGPSKTADIEGVLVKGVHGPGQVCCMVVVG